MQYSKLCPQHVSVEASEKLVPTRAVARECFAHTAARSTIPCLCPGTVEGCSLCSQIKVLSSQATQNSASHYGRTNSKSVSFKLNRAME